MRAALLLIAALPAAALLVACGDKEDSGQYVYVPPDEDDGDGDCDTGNDADCDGYPDDQDCDPYDSFVNPGMSEIPYDGLDNDCGGDGDLNDVDGDGFIGGPDGDDCNDGNPDAYPGATEQCYNPTDEDCDGVAQGYKTNDCDEDGYEDRGEDGDDCDPSDPEINPGADEIWYDGVDQNCDEESDYDADLDGENAVEYGGTDCDDTDVTINSKTVELWDALDNNCNTILDDIDVNDAWDATESVVGGTDKRLGWAIASLDDLDADGYVEFAVGAPESNPTGKDPSMGQVRILPSSGGSGAPSARADATITGGAASDWFGWDLDSLGDIDGDGDADLAVGAPGAGMVYLFSGAELTGSAALDTGDAFTTITVGEDQFGADVGSLGDIDGDGEGDLAAGSGTLLRSGELWVGVWLGSDLDDGGTLDDGDALATVEAGSISAESITGADLDGDGTSDLVVAYEVDDAAELAIISGADLVIGGDFRAGDLPSIVGPAGVRAGTQGGFLEDADGDGYSELIFSAPDAETADGVAGAGIVYVVDGDVASNADGALSSLTSFSISGERENGALAGLDQGGDFDGDGYTDLVVSTIGDSASTLVTVSYLFYGDEVSAGGAYLTSDRSASFTAGDTQDYTGYAGMGEDIDGDGDDDLILGAPYADARVGGVYIYRSLLVK